MHDTNGTANGTHLHRDIAEFLAEGFTKNDPVVLVSTPARRRALEDELGILGFQLFEMECQGRSRWFDSHDVLAYILVNGVPDRARFGTTMAEVLSLDSNAATGRRTRAYYDLVDVLRERGNDRGARLLDRLWTDLCERHADLMLAYTVANLYREKDCAV